MKSIKSVYKIGHGPSSSHTVGPFRAAKWFRARFPQADGFRVTLYGSLAFTGEGHGTYKAIKAVLPEAEIVFDRETTDLPHPNTMRFEAFCGGEKAGEETVLSVGGGSLHIQGSSDGEDPEVYSEEHLSDIIAVCKEEGIGLAEFIYKNEAEDIHEYLHTVWRAMQDAVERGLQAEGVLPGGLGVTRKAKMLLTERSYHETQDVASNRMIASYAYAVMEENADEHVVVTAPTCGSCGVLPSVLYYMQHTCGYPENEILDALAVAGLVGNIIRTNASISGAECGCQAEIGSACSMTAAAYALLRGLNIDQIEYAAEIAMEHNLGLTCDPVQGLVQIPCIERNAVAAMTAMTSTNLARFLYRTRKISFDNVVETMYRTGLDMDRRYKETSHGGLAAIYRA